MTQLRKVEKSEWELLVKAYFALMLPGDLRETDWTDDSARFVAIRKGGAALPTDIVDMVLLSGRPEIAVDLGGILAYGEILLLRTPEDVEKYAGENIFGTAIHESDLPAMLFGGFFLPSESQSYRDLWAVALEEALRLGMRSVMAIEGRPAVQCIEGQKIWWADDEDGHDKFLTWSPAPASANMVLPTSANMVLDVISGEKIAGALKSLCAFPPEWVGEKPALLK